MPLPSLMFQSIIKPLSVIGSVVLLLITTGCSDSDMGVATSTQSIHGSTMGTRYNITFVTMASNTVDSQSLQSGVDQLLQQINQSMSTYIPDSEINRFNNHPINEWMPVSADMYKVINRAQVISRLSNGAFDITVGPLVDLWGFGPKFSTKKIPSSKQLSEIQKRIGYQAIEVDDGQSRIRKIAPRRLDLSAIAKGYATDVVAQYLQQQGIEHFIVEIGGEMRLKGNKPNGDEWRIAIETPDGGERSVMKLLSLTNVSIATSGNYRNYFDVDGQRYSHSIDPITGQPVRHYLVSATAITKNCIDADGFATAMMVMGVEKSIALAERENIAVYLIENTKQGFIEHKSSAFLAYVKEQ